MGTDFYHTTQTCNKIFPKRDLLYDRKNLLSKTVRGSIKHWESRNSSVTQSLSVAIFATNDSLVNLTTVTLYITLTFEKKRRGRCTFSFVYSVSITTWQERPTMSSTFLDYRRINRISPSRRTINFNCFRRTFNTYSITSDPDFDTESHSTFLFLGGCLLWL